MAAADEPRPRACGIRLAQRRASPGGWPSNISNVCRMARTTRCASPAFAVSDPSPATAMDRPPAVTRASTTSCRDTARPRLSNPGPRLALVAGTRTLTARSVIETVRHQARPTSSQAEGGGGRAGVGGDGGRGRGAGQGPVRVLQAVAGDRADHPGPGRDLAGLTGAQQAG